MKNIFKPCVRFFKSTPNRTFILYPIAVILWEYHANEGRPAFSPYYLPVMIWGYCQYRFTGIYRRRMGGGGPGLENPPERLVVSGIYRFIRNPMYLGHIIFLIGLSLLFRSILAALIAAGTAVWFHFRVLGDEARLIDLFGDNYSRYMKQTKRWIPGIY